MFFLEVFATAIFLERGHRGVIPCPPIESGQLTPREIAAHYWYFKGDRDGDLLISYFRERVAPQNDIPEGVYDIDGNFSLVIENVTDSDEGNYYCKTKPRSKLLVEGQLTVAIKGGLLLH